jgi:phage-related minor tail protein
MGSRALKKEIPATPSVLLRKSSTIHLPPFRGKEKKKEGLTMPDQTQTTFDNLSLRTQDLRNEMQDLSKLADSFGNKLVGAFASAIIHGRSLGDIVKGLALSLSQTALSAALKPLGNLVGSLFSGAQNNTTPFADGGVVNSPMLFPMRGGNGLMGEAGPEAIMPLARGADGKLGVRGGGGNHVTINISTPDIQSFRQSQGQIVAMMNQALQRGQRNL